MIGERFKKIIKILGLTNVEFAESLGLTKAAVSEIIHGRVKKPSGPLLELLKIKFNINPTWLLTGEGDMFLPGKGTIQELNTPLDIIDGQAVQHPELDILPKIAHTGWWQSLSETEREIIVFITHLKDSETKKKLRDLVEIALKKEISEEEFKKQLEGLDDHRLRQKGATG